MPATSVVNALIAFIEGLGLAAYSDTAPADEQTPYVTIRGGIAVIPDDRTDGGNGVTGAETMQVDLWERWKDEDDEIVESPTLAGTVARALHGASLDMAPLRVYGVSVVSSRRLPDLGASTVHTAITAIIRRIY